MKLSRLKTSCLWMGLLHATMYSLPPCEPVGFDPFSTVLGTMNRPVCQPTAIPVGVANPTTGATVQIPTEIVNSKKEKFQMAMSAWLSQGAALTETQRQLQQCGFQYNSCDGAGGSKEECATIMNACIDSVSGASPTP